MQTHHRAHGSDGRTQVRYLQAGRDGSGASKDKVYDDFRFKQQCGYYVIKTISDILNKQRCASSYEIPSPTLTEKGNPA